ncbi:HNH endonuclease [Prevotella communis]|nr:HNH endonuclease [Prevotella communis]
MFLLIRNFAIKYRSKGGRTVVKNCQMLCRECNRRKGSK